ncbi:T9SS type A sorting domain-containing protein [Porphyromonas gulae]|uniref:T9SS type A sorting domain-containing protein n=1 Tax=Porphyromonas gulae TaxID=111105 RepID=UPI0006188879|nr:T9SS type A sorting domain-containing protein [Porphyromonas gulae]KKC50967.1 thioredoxin [Porphyromonas gulae]
MKRLLLSAAILSSMALFNVNAQELKTSADMKGSFKKNVVIEVYTSESCPACPNGKTKIANAISMLDAEYQTRVFQAYVHTKFYGDGIVTQWPRVQQLANALVGMLKFGYLPSMTIDRTEKKATNQNEQLQLSVPSPNVIKNKIMKAFGDGTAPAEVTLKLTKGATPQDFCTATVKGKLDAELIEKPLLLSIYLLKNNLEPLLPPQGNAPSGQAGASAGYLHQHTVLMILTDNVKGDTFDVAADGSFTVKKEFKLDGFDVKDTDVLAFVHHPMSDADHSIINAGQESLDKAEPTATEQIVATPSVKAYVQNGKIVVEEEYSKMEVFNATGQLVKNESLVPGVYVVRITANGVMHFLKVLVP